MVRGMGLLQGLSGENAVGDDAELRDASQHEVSALVRQFCGALHVSSSLMAAIALYPGVSDEQALSEATRELTERAARMVRGAFELARAKAVQDDDLKAFLFHMKRQAADLVAAQWRVEHSGAGEPMPVDRMLQIFEQVAGSADEDDGVVPLSVDELSAKRLALLSVLPVIFDAVNRFDFFADPLQVVSEGANVVVSASREATERLFLGRGGADALHRALGQAVVRRTGYLYAANYDACSRRVAAELMAMPEDQQFLVIEEAKQNGGLPRDLVETSFWKLMDRMVGMVCEALPDTEPVRDDTYVEPDLSEELFEPDEIGGIDALVDRFSIVRTDEGGER